MTDDLEIFRQTFDAIEQSYDIEPVVSEVAIPTPGFFRRKSSRPPVGTMSLFELDELSRTEYDHG